VLPIFPLRGAILLPRATLALNVFEPRYLVLVDYALAGDRLIGIVQPAPEAGDNESPTGKSFPLRRVGCVGRITAFSEGDDGRLTLSLTGITRFRLLHDVESDEPFRFCRAFYPSIRKNSAEPAQVGAPTPRPRTASPTGSAPSARRTTTHSS